jgi:glycosyltransferase involved in cell wall biosynthesis
VKVLVVTTSYPPHGGSFVAASVEAVRLAGFDVEVVSPSSFRHFGIAGGHGIVGNLRARPWLALLVPAMLWNMRRAAARVECDLVHAHWLVCGVVAATLRKPYVVQPWGTDVALLGRLPWRFPRVIAASRFLAEQMGGAEIVPTPVPIPERVGEPEEICLFAGRLSPEKGIEEFLAATAGLPRIVVGAGPVEVPESVGEVADVGPYYERAAVVVVPSRREGYGMVAREAMAYGRAVVATEVGGLRDAIQDGVDGLLVAPGDVRALRAAVERLLGDGELRRRLGSAAREKAVREWSTAAAAHSLSDAYRSSVDAGGRGSLPRRAR